MNPKQPSSVRAAAAANLPIASVAGVSRYAIGDAGGSTVAAHGPTDRSDESIAVALVVSNAFSAIGTMLGLGAIQTVSAKAQLHHWLIAYRGGYCIVIAFDPPATLAAVEQALTAGDWVPKPEWEVDDSEIHYVAPKVQSTSSSQAGPPRPAQSIPTKAATLPRTRSDESLQGRPPPRAPALAAPETATAPIAKSATTPANPSTGAVSLGPQAPSATTARPASEAAPRANVSPTTVSPRATGVPSSTLEVRGTTLADYNAKGLRRAIARGDLRAIGQITDHLRLASASKTDPCGAGDSAVAIPPLLSGIAAVLSGDHATAISALDAVGQMPNIGFTLSWAALVWSARASIGMSEGLDSALVYAESAARVSKQLDVEARALSNRLLGEVWYHRREPGEAGRYIELASRLLEPIQDAEGLAELSLLQAKTALLSGHLKIAEAAATKANRHRLDWAAPVVLLCRAALAKPDLAKAREWVSGLIAQGSNAPETLRLWRLLDSIEGNQITAAQAASFLALEDAPPSRANIEELQALGRQAPGVACILETIGWKCLRSGKFIESHEAFSKLAEHTDLPDDVRSSVMLGLGCLATHQVPGASSDSKLRAVVNAAPVHLKSERPPARPSAQFKAASPVDMVDLEPPPASLAYTSAADRIRGTGHPQPPGLLFSGNLEVFCLPDLLEFLRAGRRTGTLVCSSVRGIGAVQLTQGMLTGAIAPGTPRFQEFVVSQGKLSQGDLTAELSKLPAHQHPVPLGTALVRSGKLSQADLESLLRSQIEMAVSELLEWNEGQFAFEPEPASPETKSIIEISLDPQSVLLEIFRNLDERDKGYP